MLSLITRISLTFLLPRFSLTSRLTSLNICPSSILLFISAQATLKQSQMLLLDIQMSIQKRRIVATPMWTCIILDLYLSKISFLHHSALSCYFFLFFILHPFLTSSYFYLIFVLLILLILSLLLNFLNFLHLLILL